VASAGGGGFIVVWESDGQDGSSIATVARRYDGAGTPQGEELIVNTYTTGAQNLPAVAMSADERFVVVWNSFGQDGSLDGVLGRRYAVPQLLAAKRLVIKNTVPDQAIRTRGLAVSRDPTIEAGTAGGPADPRAAGGTVRFISDTSGQDTGPLPLPAANWRPLGPTGAPTGWRYTDREQDDGPCRTVIVKRGRLAKAVCSGRNPLSPLPFDLTAGTDQGRVGLVLIVATRAYCLGLEAVAGKDGSDGKTFLGRDAAAPAACPAP
jgi:hypothetical protein